MLYNKGYGGAAEELYNNNTIARKAMDHPYAAGAVVGVAAGAAAVGTVAAINAVTLRVASLAARYAYTAAAASGGGGRVDPRRLGQAAHVAWTNVASKVIPGVYGKQIPGSQFFADQMNVAQRTIIELKPVASATLSKTLGQIAKYKDLGFKVYLRLY